MLVQCVDADAGIESFDCAYGYAGAVDEYEHRGRRSEAREVADAWGGFEVSDLRERDQLW